jgi:hypothetical protein
VIDGRTILERVFLSVEENCAEEGLVGGDSEKRDAVVGEGELGALFSILKREEEGVGERGIGGGGEDGDGGIALLGVRFENEVAMFEFVRICFAPAIFLGL